MPAANARVARTERSGASAAPATRVLMAGCRLARSSLLFLPGESDCFLRVRVKRNVPFLKFGHILTSYDFRTSGVHVFGGRGGLQSLLSHVCFGGLWGLRTGRRGLTPMLLSVRGSRPAASARPASMARCATAAARAMAVRMARRVLCA